MGTKIINFITKYKRFFIFFALFSLYFTLALSLCFFNEDIYNYIDIWFNTDIDIIYDCFAKFEYEYDKTVTHPFLLIAIHPLVSFFNIFFHSPKASLLALSSAFGSLSTILIYLSLVNFTNKKLLSTILSSIYYFSFSVIIFSSIIEIYIYAGFFTSVFVYYISLLYKNKTQLKFVNYFTIALILIIGFGINPPILFSNLILLLWFLLKNKKNKLESIICLGKIILIVLSLYISFSAIQKIAYPNTPIFFKNINSTQAVWQKRNKKDIGQIGNYLFVSSFYGLKLTRLKETINNKYVYRINFCSEQNKKDGIPFVIFLFTGIIFYLFNFKNIKTTVLS